ncbi:hypothetical protein [Mycolicibacterium stellerae]|uniref:hypothetical protein n=1 Tax=Mycolicibacterium stellerae TaxID=2358193 RepID=UPI0013DDBFB2|nr:hypothetical protein [Mycolicibacterium stellerae]
MTTTTTRVKFLAAAVGAATMSAATNVSPAPARAEGCAQWEFSGTFSWVTDVSDVVSSVPAQGTHIDGRYSVGSISDYGSVQGDITGNTVSLKIGSHSNDVTYSWTGQIDPAGDVSGPVASDPGNRWHSMSTPLVCKATLPPPTPPEVTLRYDAATLVGITAWVGMTDNAGKPAVNCTYSDGVLPPRPFSVYGDKETRIDLPGIPTGHVYNVVVECGDLTHMEQKQF